MTTAPPAPPGSDPVAPGAGATGVPVPGAGPTRGGDAGPVASVAAPPERFTRAWWASLAPLPRPPLAAVVAGGAIAVGLGVPAALLVGAIVVAAAVDGVLAGGAWRIAVGRELPEAVTLGESDVVGWLVRGSRPWAQRVEVADELAPSLGVVRRIAATVRADRTTRVAAPMRPSRRGPHRPSELVVRLAGPLRLVARQHARSLPGRVDVLPAFPSRHQAELRITDRRVLEAGVRSARLVGSGTEFESLRDYTPDDQVRRVDWSATARAGRPIVRTYRVERNQTVQVVLDVGRHTAGLVDASTSHRSPDRGPGPPRDEVGLPGAGAGMATRLDHLMDAALAVTTVATAVGDKVGFQAFATDLVATVPPSGDRRQRSRIATAMAALEPLLVESDYARAFTDVVARQRRRALLVVLTDLASEALVDTLVPALPVLLSSHLVVVGAVEDPRVTAWVERPGTDGDDAWLAAGAATLQRSRRRTARLLARRGAVVVDAAPGRLAGALMDAYLDLKARGRL